MTIKLTGEQAIYLLLIIAILIMMGAAYYAAISYAAMKCSVTVGCVP